MIGGIPFERRGRADGGGGGEGGGCQCQDQNQGRMRDENRDREEEEYGEQLSLLHCREMRGEVRDGGRHGAVAKEEKLLSSTSQ